MKKLLSLLMIPVCAMGASWAIPEADNIHPFDTSGAALTQPAVLANARRDLREELAAFQAEASLDGAFELLEDTLILEAMRTRRAIPLACFKDRNPSLATSDAPTHYLIGDPSLGSPVVPLARDQEPLYWELDQLQEYATDPFFEFQDSDLLGLIEERAQHALNESSR